MILGRNFKFLLSMCIVKLDLEMMFDNCFSNKKVNSTIEGHFEISPVAVMDIFQRGLGQNFKFLPSLCMVKLDLGMMFDDFFE